MEYSTDLIIVGGGAAGLMAGVTAGEQHLKCLILERRHRPGLKLLMCGNNRCNVSHVQTTDGMLEDYGAPLDQFLRRAIEGLNPKALCAWFREHNLQIVQKGDRYYPHSEKSDDVLHCFTDALRDVSVPIMFNSPVLGIVPLPEGGYRVNCSNVTLTARAVLLATGGVSYPKTGSVGDGQRMAAELGLAVTPLRPGLAGVAVSDDWLQITGPADIPEATVKVYGDGVCLGETHGNILCQRGGLYGQAIFNATRLIAHANATTVSLSADLIPNLTVPAASARISRAGLRGVDIPPELAASMKNIVPADNPAAFLKNVPLAVTAINPIKEAIVTVGGIALSEVNSDTMEMKRLPGLYAAGEVLDVDGPTGGYNLHAAFSTARLAVLSVARKLSGKSTPELPKSTPKMPGGAPRLAEGKKNEQHQSAGKRYSNSQNRVKGHQKREKTWKDTPWA